MGVVATHIIDSSAMARTRNSEVAAVAECNGLTLLHYDSDFDTIAEVTGQDTRWVVPRGQTP